jgi:glycosyltransferase involved in cell wall biosynthesis
MGQENSMPLVSIIVNNHNYGRYLRQAIESALCQTYKRREVIVVDDGSTDESRTILQGYDGRITTILQPNAGQGAAINRGFAHSSGELILFLDSDDFLAPTTVETAVAHWEDGVTKLQFPLLITDANGNPTGALNPSGRMRSGNVLEAILQSGCYASSPTTGNVFDRRFLTAILPMPAPSWRAGADGYLVYSAPFFGPIKSLDQPLAYYRAHELSATNMSGIKNMEGKKLLKLLSDDVRRLSFLKDLASSRGFAVSPSAVLFTWSHAKLRLAAAKLRLRPPDYSVDNVPWLACRVIVAAFRGNPSRPLGTLLRSGWALAVMFSPRAALPGLLGQGFNASSRPAWIQRLF